MTVEEKFSRFTIEELKDGIAAVSARIADHRAAMEKMRTAKQIEFFKMTERLYEEDCAILLDAQCALDSRLASA